MLSINKLLANHNLNNVKDPKLIALQTQFSNIGKKLHIITNIHTSLSKNLKQITLLLDSGAEVSICQLNYLMRLYPHIKKEQIISSLKESSIKLTSYTEDSIEILGSIDITIHFGESGKKKLVNFCVCNGPASAPGFLLGVDLISTLNMNIKFVTTGDIKTPQVSLDDDTYIPAFYLSDQEMTTTETYIEELMPNESRTVQFFIPVASSILSGDKILITNDNISVQNNAEIQLISSSSDARFNPNYKQCIALAKLTNRGKTIFSGKITTNFENVSDCQINNLDHNTVNELEGRSLLLETNRFYDPHSSHTIDVSEFETTEILEELPTHVYNISVTSTPEMIIKEKTYAINNANLEIINNGVKDLNFSKTEERYNIKQDTATTEELSKFFDPQKTVNIGPSYEEGELDPEIMAPRGHTLPEPNLEFIKPEDKIILTDYEEIIRPYVKDIFLNNYPNVIALHSFDRGILSKTLGFYNIRLRPGFKLPVHKRLYYLSPADSSHLKEIISFLIKNKSVSKAPVEGDKLALFASPSYIIPKKDKNATARLVCDYSKINKAISNECVVIPSIDVVLNSLRSSVIYSSFDFTSAFHAVSIDPSTRHLSAFSTPQGVFYWNSLPTGMSCSP